MTNMPCRTLEFIIPGFRDVKLLMNFVRCKTKTVLSSTDYIISSCYSRISSK